MEIKNNLAMMTQWWNLLDGQDQTDSTGSTSLLDTVTNPWWGESDSDQGSTGDTLSLSPELSLIKMKFQEAGQNIMNSYIEQEFGADAREQTEDFGNRLREELESLGVSTEQEIGLTLDESGLVKVTNDHPDKEKIEGFFLQNGEWSEAYADVHLRNMLVRAGEKAGLARSSQNPYLKNQLSWEQLTIQIKADSTAIDFS